MPDKTIKAAAPSDYGELKETARDFGRRSGEVDASQWPRLLPKLADAIENLEAQRDKWHEIADQARAYCDRKVGEMAQRAEAAEAEASAISKSYRQAGEELSILEAERDELKARAASMRETLEKIITANHHPGSLGDRDWHPDDEWGKCALSPARYWIKTVADYPGLKANQTVLLKVMAERDDLEAKNERNKGDMAALLQTIMDAEGFLKAERERAEAAEAEKRKYYEAWLKASDEINKGIAERDKLRTKLQDARNRLDTIRETNPEISLDHDIELIDALLEKGDE